MSDPVTQTQIDFYPSKYKKASLLYVCRIAFIKILVHSIHSNAKQVENDTRLATTNLVNNHRLTASQLSVTSHGFNR